MKPKRAGKRGICVQKLSLARAWAFTDKTYECLSMIFSHLTPRMVRRDIDYVKNLIGVECRHTLGHWLHAHGLGFTCPNEKASYLDQDEKLRKAA